MIAGLSYATPAWLEAPIVGAVLLLIAGVLAPAGRTQLRMGLREAY